MCATTTAPGASGATRSAFRSRRKSARQPLSEVSIRVDLRGAEEGCGEPALERVRRAASRLETGATLAVITDVADQAFAVRTWSRRNGLDVVGDDRDAAGVTRLTLTRPSGAQAAQRS